MLEMAHKKHKVSKKTKKSWRKHVNIQDVNNFLDNVRLEERLGTSFSLRKNEELFAIDKKRNTNNVNKYNNLTKHQYRSLMNNTEPNCFAILKSSTAVTDPILKRNHIKTKEEKKSSILKQIESKKKLKDQLKLKDRAAIQNISSQKNKINNCKSVEFNIDIWGTKPIELELQNEWLTNDTKKHILANTGRKQKRVPKSFYKKPSVLPTIIKPHPGTSYNPSYIDHEELLTKLTIDEIKLIKKEEHLTRVTKNMFCKVIIF
jgi:nucleolar protein 53